MEYSFRIAELITKEIKGEIKPDEKHELDLWINESSENKKIYEEAIDPKFQLDQLDVFSHWVKPSRRTNLATDEHG